MDLSTSPRKIGLARLTWNGSEPAVAHFEEAPKDWEALARKIAGSVKAGAVWAIDVPFGWPRALSGFLSEHASGPVALPAAEGSKARWTTLARRCTDLNVIQTKGYGVSGFSVSFDKLGATAAAWAHVEWLLKTEHQLEVNRAGTWAENRSEPAIVETYPAAAWHAWGQQRTPASTTWPKLNKPLAGVVDSSLLRVTTSHPNEHQRDAQLRARGPLVVGWGNLGSG